MRLELTGRHLTITPATRALVEDRIAHTLRLLNNRAVSAHVVLTRERTRIRAEVTLHARQERFLHGEATGTSLALAIGAAAEKIERQARTLKSKLDGRKRRGLPAVATPVVDIPPPPRPAGPAKRRIIRARPAAVKPMSIEDAAAELGDGGDGVIVFRNSATDAVTVLFRRADGHLGLIEPEP